MHGCVQISCRRSFGVQGYAFCRTDTDGAMRLLLMSKTAIAGELPEGFRSLKGTPESCLSLVPATAPLLAAGRWN
jgi:hypothetical protein